MNIGGPCPEIERREALSIANPSMAAECSMQNMGELF
jgi:hypothetical protein